MSVQNRTDFTNYVFVRSGSTFTRENETILQDAARATPLLKFTVMAQIAATKKWVPLTDVAALDGTNTARGIYVGEDITAAALVAGDVTVCPILVGFGCTVDRQLIVLENALTLDSVCSDDSAGADNGPVNVRRVEDDLVRVGIFAEYTFDIDRHET